MTTEIKDESITTEPKCIASSADGELEEERDEFAEAICRGLKRLNEDEEYCKEISKHIS
jgi:lipoate-protein ligase A